MRTILGPLALYAFTFGLCVALIGIPSSCSSVNCKDPANATSSACTVHNAEVDCAGGDIAGAIALFAPKIEAIITNGITADGSIDWTSVGNGLEAAVVSYGWCAVSEVFASYMTPTPPTASVAAAAGSGGGSETKPKTRARPSPESAKATFNHLREKLRPGTTFRTSKGTL
jgi:hypothetical protein